VTHQHASVSGSHSVRSDRQIEAARADQRRGRQLAALDMAEHDVAEHADRFATELELLQAASVASLVVAGQPICLATP
jgi:hypothetical protein